MTELTLAAIDAALAGIKRIEVDPSTIVMRRDVYELYQFEARGWAVRQIDGHYTFVSKAADRQRRGWKSKSQRR